MAYLNNQTLLWRHSYRWPPSTNQTLRTPVGGGHGRSTDAQQENVGNDSERCSAEFRKLHLSISHIADSHKLNIRQRPQRESTFCKWYHRTTCFCNESKLGTTLNKYDVTMWLKVTKTCQYYGQADRKKKQFCCPNRVQTNGWRDAVVTLWPKTWSRGWKPVLKSANTLACVKRSTQKNKSEFLAA